MRLLLSSPFDCAPLHMVTDRSTECLTSRLLRRSLRRRDCTANEIACCRRRRGCVNCIHAQAVTLRHDAVYGCVPFVSTVSAGRELDHDRYGLVPAVLFWDVGHHRGIESAPASYHGVHRRWCSDWNTTPLLRRALSEARWDDSVHLVIDLSAVTSMDSAGPYTLLEARFKHHLGGGGHLAVIADPDSHAIPELQIVALTASFDFHSTLADALHACASADTSTSHEPNRPAIHATCSPTHRAQLATSPVFDK